MVGIAEEQLCVAAISKFMNIDFFEKNDILKKSFKMNPYVKRS